MNHENWKEIGGYEELYEVSDIGRVRRIAPYRQFVAGRIKAQYVNRGYPVVCLSNKNTVKTPLVHGLVAAAFIGPKPPGLEVNHKNGIKTDNRTENLEYVTRSENQLHAYRIGLQKPAVGENHGRSKLTKGDVRLIRLRRSAGEKMADLAEKFKCHVNHIADIVHFRKWAFMKEDF